jgi:hypothetical protein
MFTDFDSDDFAKLGRLTGIALFVIALLLPAVGDGVNMYRGWACAAWTLYGTLSFVGSVFGPDGPNGFIFFFMISGWISPLVAIGIFIDSDQLRRIFARITPFLLVVPWIVFAWPQTGWGRMDLHPRIGHYVWTAGCLLVFTPQYAAMFSRASSAKASAKD